MKKIYLFFIIIYLNLFSSFSYSIENKILFKINDEIITSIDLLNEIEYLNLFNKNIKNFREDEILIIAKNSIIKEKIKKIEILKYTDKLLLNDDIYYNILKDILKNTNLENLDKFNDYLKLNILDKNLIKEKISIQIIWNDLISSKYSNKIKINEQEIKNELLRIQKNTSKSFLISELLFEINEGEIMDDKYSEIKKTINEEGFEKAVTKYSISDSSLTGGTIGWVKESIIDNKLKQVLLETKINEFTTPIQVLGGFLILKVSDIKTTQETIDIEKETLKIKNLKINKQLEQFSNLYFNKVKKEVTINEL